MSRPRPRPRPRSSTRTWWEVPLEVPARLEEPVVAALWDEGCLGVETRGLAAPRTQPGGTWGDRGPRATRSRIPLAVFFPGTLRAEPLRGRVRRALAATAIPPRRRGRGPRAASGIRVGRPRRVADRRWVEEWQKTLRPMPIGRRLLALPEGLNPPEAARRIALRIPFGQAFGTGEHASTRLSLALLETHMRRGDDVLDLGTGTGILALAALRLGARWAHAVDADPVAIAVARRTLKMNRIRSGLTLRRADAAAALRGRRFDFALVNIGARVIRDVMPLLGRAAAPGARVVLAGILVEDERDLLRRARAAGLRLEKRLRSRPWSALLLSAPARRRSPSR